MTGDLAARHISASVAVDDADESNGPLEMPAQPGTHTRGVLAHRDGVIDAQVASRSPRSSPLPP